MTHLMVLRMACFPTLARSIITASSSTDTKKTRKQQREYRTFSKFAGKCQKAGIQQEEMREYTQWLLPMQGEPRESREHSPESPDPMASIRNLHIQTKTKRR